MHVLKPEVVEGKEGTDLIAVDCEKADNWLPRNEIEIGSGTKRMLASKTEDKKKTLRLAFRKCLKTMAIHKRSSASKQCSTAISTVFTPSGQKSRNRKSLMNTIRLHLQVFDLLIYFCTTSH